MTKRQNFYEFQLDRKGRKQKRLCAVLKKKTEPQIFFKEKKKTKQIFHFIRLWNIKEQKKN